MSGQSTIEQNPFRPIGSPSLDQTYSLLGVEIDNVSKNRAIEMLENVVLQPGPQPASVYFVNAHTLNLAAGDREYCEMLNEGDFVFGDGTGVRWAARLMGIRVLDNLEGTDFTPDFFLATGGRGFSYFMLGSDETTLARAADYAENRFPGWTLAGCHHGYLNTPEKTASAVEKINRVRPDVLLVGMGNPIQEKWIHQHRRQLQASLCLGIGGLFDYWAGNVSRSPAWLRRLGHEWIWRLFQQPRDKAKRYLIGNPLFLARICRERWGKRS